MNEANNEQNQDLSHNKDNTTDQRISKAALTGAIILPFGLFLGLFFIPISARTTPAPPASWQILLRYTLLPMSVLAPFASTISGIIGIAEIRNSKSKKYGMPLAVFVGLFYPIIIITLVLLTIGWLFLGNIEGWNFIPVIWLFLVLVIDFIIIRVVWNFATRGN